MHRLLPALLLLGCPGDTPDETVDAQVAAQVDCQLGIADGDGDGFSAMDADGALEMLQGFQGFLVVLPRVRVEAPAEPMDLSFSVELAGEAPFGGVQLATPLFEAGDGGSVTDDIVVFLTPTDISHFKDRPATLSVRLDSAAHTCLVQREVLLVDRDVCVHAGDDPVCPDAGVDGG